MNILQARVYEIVKIMSFFKNLTLENKLSLSLGTPLFTTVVGNDCGEKYFNFYIAIEIEWHTIFRIEKKEKMLVLGFKSCKP